MDVVQGSPRAGKGLNRFGRRLARVDFGKFQSQRSTALRPGLLRFCGATNVFCKYHSTWANRWARREVRLSFQSLLELASYARCRPANA